MRYTFSAVGIAILAFVAGAKRNAYAGRRVTFSFDPD